LTKKSTLIDNILESILEKKGKEIINIDLSPTNNPFCDNFIICHGDSKTQVNAIAESIEKRLKEKMNKKTDHIEGTQNAQWVLMVYDSIVIHIFSKETRDFYKLEELWADARIEKIEESFN
jgi:ribosome-associated protein